MTFCRWAPSSSDNTWLCVDFYASNRHRVSNGDTSLGWRMARAGRRWPNAAAVIVRLTVEWRRCLFAVLT
ncbi:unnamed protein product [Soboliphyme baturini]|uniref:F5/8 type C domain-containing protein n=1 Tax=Soboliphyme baturini TaxID=241478 RepID=A0A183IBM1_9BILA|nr:unnamed protein product [Soboliphyme baturini]